MGVIVNTGRQAFDLSVGQVWKDRDNRSRSRLVRITEIGRTHVSVRNTGSNRLARIHLQDFVARFDLEAAS